MLKRLKRLKLPALRLYTLLAAVICCAAGVALALLWDKYANAHGPPLWHNVLSTIGFFFAVIAWFFYLSLDSFTPFRALSQAFNAIIGQSKPDRGKGMLQHIDTEPDGNEMDGDDRKICLFAAFLLSALLAQLPSLAVLLMR